MYLFFYTSHHVPHSKDWVLSSSLTKYLEVASLRTVIISWNPINTLPKFKKEVPRFSVVSIPVLSAERGGTIPPSRWQWINPSVTNLHVQIKPRSVWNKAGHLSGALNKSGPQPGSWNIGKIAKIGTGRRKQIFSDGNWKRCFRKSRPKGFYSESQGGVV